MTGRTARTTENPLRLLARALGPPPQIAAKSRRLMALLVGYVRPQELDQRLARLVELGYLDQPPTRLQLVIGSYDMLRFFIVPAARDYYESQGISFNFHQVLRFLDDPASVLDPTGFLAGRDVVIGHLMQVVHANPTYDLQLLESYEEGLESLEQQVIAMIAGTHPRTESIGAITEDPAYHARLLAFVRAFRQDRGARAPIRENIERSPELARVERTFGALPDAMRYFAVLPTDVRGALRHVREHRQFPVALAERARRLSTDT